MNITRLIYLIILIFFFCTSSFLFKSCKSKSIKMDSNKIFIVKDQPIIKKLYYSGSIKPLKNISITSPVDGIIDNIHFNYGEYVKSGTVLLSIRSEKFKNDFQTALIQYIKTKNEFQNEENLFKENKFLFENKLIAKDEFKNKKNLFYNAKLSYIQSQELLKNLIQESDSQISLSDMNIENADIVLNTLREKNGLQIINIKTSNDGILLSPIKEDENNPEIKKLHKGDQVKLGEILCTIGDMTGLSVHFAVNELEISQFFINQDVKVYGPAFSHILKGRIASIDRQGQSSQSGISNFSIEVVIPELTDEERKNIYIGMSATAEIDITEKNTISIPIKAIIERNGHTYVNKINKLNKQIQLTEVKTGITTLDSIVIEKNLKVGDLIVLDN